MKLISICSIFLLSCIVNKKTIIGSYKSEKPTLLNNLFSTNCYIKNLSIELFKDSTFKYYSCAQVSEGKWWVVKDTLFMKCQSIKYIEEKYNNDPQYAKGLICFSEVEHFLIKNNKLESTITVNKKKCSIVLSKENS